MSKTDAMVTWQSAPIVPSEVHTVMDTTEVILDGEKEIHRVLVMTEQEVHLTTQDVAVQTYLVGNQTIPAQALTARQLARLERREEAFDAAITRTEIQTLQRVQNLGDRASHNLRVAAARPPRKGGLLALLRG